MPRLLGPNSSRIRGMSRRIRSFSGTTVEGEGPVQSVLSLFDTFSGTDGASLQDYTIVPVNNISAAYTQSPAGTATTADVVGQDDFTASNGTTLDGRTLSPTDPGDTWAKVTIQGTITGDIQSNRARHLQGATGDGGVGYHIADFGESDVTITTTMQSSHADHTLDIILRETDSNNWWAASGYIGGDTWRILKKEAGSVSVVASGAMDISTATDYAVKVVANGSTITVYVNGTQIVQATNATFQQTATKHGFGSTNVIANQSSTHTDFRVIPGTLGAFRIDGGKAISQVHGGTALAYTDLGQGDFNAEVLVRLGTAAKKDGLLLRYLDASNYLALTLESGGGGMKIIKVEAGSESTLASTVPTVNTGTDYLIRVNCSGPSIVASFVGDGQANTLLYASSTFNETETKVGLYSQGVDTQFDGLTIEAIDTSGHATLNDGLISFWAGDESVSSSNDTAFRLDSGPGDWNNIMDAMGTEGPRSVSDGPGGRTAIRFDPSKKQHLLCFPEWMYGMGLGGTYDWTISLWVRLASKTAVMGIISKEDGDDNGRVREWRIDYENTSDRLRGVIFNSADTSDIAVASGPGAPAEDTWVHVILEHDAAANTLQLWQDNSAGSSASYGANTPRANVTTPVRIGTLNRDTAASLFLDGDVCLVGFWCRKLTADEKTALYNSGAGYDPTPTGNFYSRRSMTLSRRLLISYLAGVNFAGADNSWDSLQGGCVTWLWHDVDNDGTKELVAVGINRRPYIHCFKADGKVVYKNIAASAVGQDKGAYYSKAVLTLGNSGYIYYGHKSALGGNDTVYCFDLEDGTLVWSAAVGGGTLQCLELSDSGLIVGSFGAGGEIDILDYETGVSIGAPYPVSTSCWEQSLCCEDLGSGERIMTNNLTSDPTAVTIKQLNLATGGTVWTKTPACGHVDRYLIADVRGAGNVEIVFNTNDTGGWISEGDEVTLYNAAGTEQLKYTATSSVLFDAGDFFPEETGLKIVFTNESSGQPSITMLDCDDFQERWTYEINYLTDGGGQIMLGAFSGGSLLWAINDGDDRSNNDPRLVGWVCFDRDGQYVAHLKGHGWNLAAGNSPVARTCAAGFFSGQDADGDGVPEIAGPSASIEDTGYEVVSCVKLAA